MELARVVDRESLAEATGPIGRMTLCVPSAWLVAGDTIELTVPMRLACARCEGGGCDRCERRGGLKLEADESARRVRVGLPKRAETSAFVLRLSRPLGPEVALDQLVIEITTGDAPTPSCTRIETSKSPSPLPRQVVVVGLALLALAAVVAALASRR